MSKQTGRIIMCENVNDPGPTRCTTIEPRPDCHPLCGQHRQPDGYIEASQWADGMFEEHDQKQCPGCGRWTVWVPSVAADDLGRGSAS